jgi:hypothetical protein
LLLLLFCMDATWFGKDVRWVLRGSLVTCNDNKMRECGK